MENADTIKMCKQCGAPLPAEAPQGLCPKCLLQVVAMGLMNRLL